MKNNINTSEQELAQIQARMGILTTIVHQRQQQEDNRIAAEIAALPARFKCRNLKEVIQKIKDVSGIKLRAEVDDAKRARIAEAVRSQKLTPMQIAQTEGVSIPTVHAIAHAAGVIRKRGRKPSAALVN